MMMIFGGALPAAACFPTAGASLWRKLPAAVATTAPATSPARQRGRIKRSHQTPAAANTDHGRTRNSAPWIHGCQASGGASRMR